MESYGWVSILPPILAIILAIKTKQVYPSLFLGIWLGWTAVNHWNPLVGLRDALEATVNIFKDSANTKVIIFSMMVGALIILMQHSGGVTGFIQWISNKGLVNNRRGAGLLLWVIGVLIFIESNMINLVIGSIGRPIFDRFKAPREKLAYLAHSTSVPVCVMIPFNGWGAVLTGLLLAQQIENPFFTVLKAVTTNFYAIFTIILVLFIIITQKDFGPMAKAEKRARETGKLVRDGARLLVSEDTIAMRVKAGVTPRPVNMIVPLIAMVLTVPLGLLITGQGRIAQGSGSTAVFWAVLMGIFIAAMLYKVQKIFSLTEILDLVMKGMGGLIPMGLLMVFAFTMGATCNKMGTGPYVAGLATAAIHPVLVIPLVFLVACSISFATGTSWGTFAIMMPIAVPLAINMDLNLALMVSAVMGGGVFGDHCSPVSDTTIISSMASACDYIDHVDTQLPYALTAAGLALVFYTIAGYLTLS
ncbi:MAG: Na+/H+ antiporter NhaC family protein [Candidatus Zhuqueibacterota bacterium]